MSNLRAARPVGIFNNLPAVKNRFSVRRIFVALALLSMLQACSFPSLGERLLSDNPRTREKAMKRLRGLTPDARLKVIDAMVVALASPDGRLANRAAETLSAIGEPAVDPILRTLEAPDPFVRIVAANVLGDIGTRPEAVVPRLAEHLTDSHPLVREEAAHAIGRFGVRAADAIPRLQAALKDEVPEVADAARASLQKVSPPASVPTPGTT